MRQTDSKGITAQCWCNAQNRVEGINKLTWAGPQAIPTMCFVSNPGRAVGSGLVIRKVSKCWH